MLIAPLNKSLQLKRWGSILTLVIILVFNAACEEVDTSPPPNSDIYQVDPLFREFYNYLGGRDTLGVAISSTQILGNLQGQYTESALLVYDPEAPSSQYFRLAPLARDLGINEPPVPAPVDTNIRFIEGHTLYSEFIPLYGKLGGARFVGRPLTEVHFNPEKKRYEQFFENVGFYRMEGEPPGNAHLLAYGAWQCHTDCRSVQATNAIIDLPSQMNSPFKEALDTLGTNFTGFALTEAFMAQDGKTEQIFENLVLAKDASGQVSVRPLYEKLGMLAGPLVSPASGVDSPMYFYKIKDEKGHNVPDYFMDYINQHGGFGVSGPPVAELANSKGQILRQCFVNLCLLYDPDAIESLRIRPDPVGYTYKSLYYQPVEKSFASTQSLSQVSVQVWEAYPMVSSNQNQEIGVSVLDDNQPMVSVEPVLVLTLPDGKQQPYTLAPTGKDGQTHIDLPPIAASNGTLVPYQVCIHNVTGDKFCVKDSYLIWNSQ